MNRIAAAGIVMALIASIFTAAAATEADPYRVCMHVPITGAAPLPYHPDRFGGFYFAMVNAEQGGIDGHPVTFNAHNDEFNPAGARRAAERCKRDGLDLLVGPSGPNQIVSVSTWAELNGIPYLHGSIAEGSLDPGLTWSAAIAATDEPQMRMLGDAIATTADLGRTVGLVRINSPYYEPGRDALEQALAAHGLTLAADVEVQKDERQFQRVFFELQSSEVDVVVLYVTPHIATQMFNQQPMAYQPSWLSPNVGMDSPAVAQAASGRRFFVISDPAPLYDPDDTSLPWYDEIVEFHRVFDTYSPEQTPPRGSADWTSYLRAKQIHRFLDALDGNVSPAAIQASFSTYSETADEAFPTCALDFAARPRFGSNAWHVLALDGSEWEPIFHCADELSTDLSPPEIDCGGTLALLAQPLRCTLTDAGSGVGAYQVTVEGQPFGGATSSGDGACVEALTVEIDLPPGLHRVDARASNCAGLMESRSTTIIAV